MAELVTLVDDMDESTEGVEHRTFTHDGDQYTIDLSKDNWEALSKAKDDVLQFVHKSTPVEVKRERKETALGRLSADDKKRIRADLGKGPRGTIPDAEVESWLGAQAVSTESAVRDGEVAAEAAPPARGKRS